MATLISKEEAIKALKALLEVNDDMEEAYDMGTSRGIEMAINEIETLEPEE